MSPPNREVRPYKRPNRGNTRWDQQGDDLENVSPPTKNMIRPDTSGAGGIFRLTTIPERHIYTESGDLIIGRSAYVIGHSGATFRSYDGAHTHGLSDDGDRVHIPAKGHKVSNKNDGLKRARKKVLHHRGACKAKRI